MKCPNCGSEQKYKDGRQCKSCKRKYALDTKALGYGDAYLKFLIDKVSQKGKLHFTFNQFFAVNVNNHIHSRKRKWKIITVVIAVILNIIFHNFIAFVFSIIGTITIFKFFKTKPLISKQALHKHINQWPEKEKHFRKLITAPTLATAISPNIPEDAFDYGIEKILLVDNPIYVDLIVKNKWHLELKTAVVSTDGYPKGVFEKIKNIAQTQDPTIFLLHDVDTSPDEMTSSFFDQTEYKNDIIDLGLSWDDFKDHNSLSRFEEYFKDKGPIDVIPPEKLRAYLVMAITEQIPFADILSEKDRSNDYLSFG